MKDALNHAIKIGKGSKINSLLKPISAGLSKVKTQIFFCRKRARNWFVIDFKSCVFQGQRALLNKRSLKCRSLNHGQVLNTFIGIFAVISAEITHCPLRNRDESHDLCRLTSAVSKPYTNTIDGSHLSCPLMLNVISPPSDNPLRVKGTASNGPYQLE